MIRDGKIVRPVLGISYLESKQARALGIERGVLVLDVPVNSPAYKAGMRGTRRNEMGKYLHLLLLYNPLALDELQRTNTSNFIKD